ncbi:large conductance mechanosensitive channel protein MscL [Actinomyces gaoshouyii]|uniref:Large-conductance mechanosensitive channel n=1 Tax=Actinomyces gaoshouyii TaxID=1960083 RepID=A0A8H9H9D4_9ACTO|nr:large conductance mechanosensitive channel protein MscL [Actinomyces gaoshouyii]ARD41122.1 mechanosensitive ion channel protein MscL [Actinomyces gaoshouyii]GGO94497.1 large-conductance mechanosensitive channel [Actinomyces gaoshouyii]
MIKGFKEFIAQGNALELAVAVIIGGAFKPIVDSITKVILDMVGQIVGSPNFDSILQFKIDSGSDTYIQPGTILTALINFLLVALAVYFCIVVPMNRMKALQKKQDDEKPAEPTDVQLLGEIRDLLAARNH